VKGFTEALITDFRVNAPHLRAAVVMPGWVGTSIVLNSARFHGCADGGLPAVGEEFRDNAPVSSAEAATTILEAVKHGEWRILIGADAVALDERVRQDPDATYRFDPPPSLPATDAGPDRQATQAQREEEQQWLVAP